MTDNLQRLHPEDLELEPHKAEQVDNWNVKRQLGVVERLTAVVEWLADMTMLEHLEHCMVDRQQMQAETSGNHKNRSY